MTTWTISGADAGGRLDAWLAARPEMGSRGRARDAVECGKVFLNGAELTYADAGAAPAGRATSSASGRTGRAARGLAAARWSRRAPRSASSTRTPTCSSSTSRRAGWSSRCRADASREVTLLDMVADRLRSERSIRPYVVHRIDRDTSGLVLFALTPAARDALKKQFERRTPTRVYLAVVNGTPDPPSGTWRDRLVWDKERLVQKRAHARGGAGEGRRGAVPRRRAASTWQSLVEVSLVTGKRNQIRVQAGLARIPAGRRAAVPLRPAARRGARAGVRPRRRCTPPAWASRTRPPGAASSSPPACRRTWRDCCACCGARRRGPRRPVEVGRAAGID